MSKIKITCNGIQVIESICSLTEEERISLLDLEMQDIAKILQNLSDIDESNNTLDGDTAIAVQLEMFDRLRRLLTYALGKCVDLHIMYRLED